MKDLIIVRGGGDLATGTVYKLKKSGFPVLILETGSPSAIRRNVAFCEAVYQGTQTVEDLICHLAETVDEAERLLSQGKLALLVEASLLLVPPRKPFCKFIPLPYVLHVNDIEGRLVTLFYFLKRTRHPWGSDIVHL